MRPAITNFHLWIRHTLMGRLLSLITLIMTLAMGLVALVEVRSRSEEVIDNERGRLRMVASALAVGIDGEALLAAEQALSGRDAFRDWSAAPAEIQTQQRLLARFVDQVGLGSDVYTLSLDPARIGQVAAAPEEIHDGVMRFGLSSAPRPYWHHPYAYRPEMASTLLWGREAHTRVYSDDNGTWVSAYAPVRDDAGQVVALLEVDVPVGVLLAQIWQGVVRELAVLALTLGVALVAIALVTRRVTRSVGALIEAAERFGRGDHSTPVPVLGLREVDALGRALEAARQDTSAQLRQQQRHEAALAEALQHAREAGAARTEFLATMSHELRTPIHGVLGAAHLLTSTTLTRAQRELAEMIQESGRQLTGLIDDILDFSQLDAGQAALAEVSFRPGDLARGALGRIEAAAAARGLAVSLEVGPDLPAAALGSPERLCQVLEQLLDNAAKFTEAGRIALRVDAVEGGTGIRFAVEDTGIGLAPTDQDRIFEPFVQADGSMGRRYGGSGLGLAICQRLVRRMGGRIGVESAPGRGSTFWFTVPLRAVDLGSLAPAAHTPPRQIIAPPPEEGEGEMPLHVLVAEDHPINQRVVARLLEGLGYSCDIAEDGQRAVELASQRRYRLVLMDCQMPRMDGLEAACAIRRLSAPWGAIPIVALTANAMEGDRERCLAAGMDDYLRKPVSPDLLAQALDRWSGRLLAPERLAAEG